MCKRALVIFMAVVIYTNMTGCSLESSAFDKEENAASDVKEYAKAGEFTGSIKETVEENLADDDKAKEGLNKTDDKELAEIAEDIREIFDIPEKEDVLELAGNYYKMVKPNIESDLIEQYKKLVTWNPDFSGSSTNSELALENSGNVAVTVSYTSAKNFYLSLAAAVFTLDPESSNAAGNLASAIASYCDDLRSEGSSALNEQKYYGDSIKIYQYAIAMAAASEDFISEALPLLTSLGNIYLDNKSFINAYECFSMAMSLDEQYAPARRGMYKYYMAKKEFEKALRLLDEKFYPMIMKAISKIGEEQKDITDTESPEPDKPDEVFEEDMDNIKEVEPLTTVHFIKDLDRDAANELKSMIKEVQNKIKYTAPDINLVSQYASLEACCSPLGKSALQAFSVGVHNHSMVAAIEQANDDLNVLKDFGVDLGLDVDIEKLAKDMLENPDKYEDYELDIDIPQNIEGTAEKIAESMKDSAQGLADALNSSKDDPSKLYEELAKTQPEYKIFLINPFEYANPVDIIIQINNITIFNRKYHTYSTYLSKVNMRVTETIDDIFDKTFGKIIKLEQSMEQEIFEIKQKNLDSTDEAIAIHGVHEKYYPQLNELNEKYWSQATQIACVAYKQKIKKYAEQMYNDCMKHVMLISDEEVQNKLEEKVKTDVKNAICIGLQNVEKAYCTPKYRDEWDCDCPIDYLLEKRAAERLEEYKLKCAQHEKNIEAKKRFDSGIIDKNSQYYKRCIKPYQVILDTPFFYGELGPYRTGWKVEFDFGLGKVDFGPMEYHIRNTTTYDGGIEFSKKIDIVGQSVSAKTYLKLSATQGTDGNFAMEDVDIIAGAELETNAGPSTVKAGVSVSAVRGTRLYAETALCGDKLLDNSLQRALGRWKSRLKKEMWKGSYDIGDGKIIK